MQQIIISDTWPSRFEERVNAHLKDGWKIKDGSMSTNVSTTSNSWNSRAQTSYVCSVLLEKEENT